MVRKCRFNRPTDEIDDEEYTMYTYATRIWLLQDGLDLSFEMASLYNSELREWPMENMMEFRSGYSELSKEEKERFADQLWKELEDNKETIDEWAKDNLKRFQVPSTRLMHIEYSESDHVPEFDYHG